MREIPINAIQIQKGLWAVQKIITLGSLTRVKFDLYSSNGYCFYIISANLDEKATLLPENERIYAQYASTAYQTIEQVNDNVVSVSVQDGYEIVSGSNYKNM